MSILTYIVGFVMCWLVLILINDDNTTDEFLFFESFWLTIILAVGATLLLS